VQLAKVPRATIRFPIQAPVAFWWTDENGNSQLGEGSSRDISELGAFVFAAACPLVGTRVGLKIRLEGPPDTKGIDLEGSVIRVEQPADGKGSSGFAVQTRLF
jgi:PilZ domain